MSELLFPLGDDEFKKLSIQFTKQFDTDIKRLWRHIGALQTALGLGGAGDGEWNPSSSATSSSATSLEEDTSSQSSVPGGEGTTSSSTGKDEDPSASDNEGSGSGSVTGSCCLWEWTGSSWSLVEDYTGSTCTCQAPYFSGSYVGHLYRWCCGDDEEQQTTSSSTSACGHCLWQWNYLAQYWELLSETCDADCECLDDPETVRGAFDGQIIQTECTEIASSNCGYCVWEWDATNAVWTIQTENCDFGTGTEYCNDPAFAGSFDGQTQITWCGCGRAPEDPD